MLNLENIFDVFIFVMLSAGYVCSILWLYGDMVMRGLPGYKAVLGTGLIAIPGFFAVLTLVAMPGLISVFVWLIGGLLWLWLRDSEKEPEKN